MPDIDKMEKCEICGMVAKDGKCIGCDMATSECICPVKTEEAVA